MEMQFNQLAFRAVFSQEVVGHVAIIETVYLKLEFWQQLCICSYSVVKLFMLMFSIFVQTLNIKLNCNLETVEVIFILF